MTKSTQQVGRLTIDLDAIKHNWQLLSDKVQGCTAAVVKANAYGLGVERVAPALYSQGCRDFYVATLDEGIQLRKMLDVGASIYLLAGIAEGDEQFCIKHQLIPVLSSLESIKCWAEFNASLSTSSPCVFKFDSGMTRFGLTVEEFDGLLLQSQLVSVACPIIFMSHLACADEPDHVLNKQQLHLFKLAGEKIQALDPKIKLSLANSSAIFLSEEYFFDQVRPGAALYGINPSPLIKSPMRAVVSLDLPVLQVKAVSVDRSVGYGGDARVVKGSVLAVVQGGYADGLNRTLGSIQVGYAAGIEVPVVGRISMDSTVFDITGVEGIVRGDFIQVLGRSCSKDKFRVGPGFLGYEFLTSLGNRYQRVYLDGE